MTQTTSLHQNQTSQILADRLNELRFPEGLFPTEDMARLKAIAEDEYVKLEAEFNAKFRARIGKLITRKTIGRIIGSAPSATSTGVAL